jgi:hypothetical protein
MRKPLDEIRQFCVLLLAFVLLPGQVFLVRADTRAPSNAYTAEVWYAEFTLTIKGKGKLEGEFDGDPDIEWKIDRTYYSNFKLRPTSGGNGFVNSVSVANPFTVHVTIADELKTIKKGRFQHDSFENTTTTKKWEQDAPESGNARGSYLFIDTKTRTYTIDFEFLPKSIKNAKLKLTETVEIERSEFGFGGKPTHETLPGPVTLLRVNTLKIPRVRKLGMWGGTFFSAVEGTLPNTYPQSIKYDSGDLEPEEPLIGDIPDSQTNVKVRAVCRFSKTPFY